MAAVEEQEALLKFYAGEKELDTKTKVAEEHEVLVAEGIPLHSPAAAVGSSRWSTSLCACLGSNDEFFSSDVEVCLLGICAPCVLFASNAERLSPTTENTFTNHFLYYSGLYALGWVVCGCNAFAPFLSCSFRTDMRKKYNLMGSGECFAKACGCGTCYTESSHREGIDATCDLATHYLCHRCALCQEGRELRRKMSHPGFIRTQVPTTAPTQQVMSP